ncbi:hypothetical protein EV127DRAFT_403174 [Xylaria flabelliformis]|nr:hypothetical protein EV127DRAFT_403174 [Xylaria flabelliformis]
MSFMSPSLPEAEGKEGKGLKRKARLSATASSVVVVVVVIMVVVIVDIRVVQWDWRNVGDIAHHELNRVKGSPTVQYIYRMGIAVVLISLVLSLHQSLLRGRFSRGKISSNDPSSPIPTSTTLHKYTKKDIDLLSHRLLRPVTIIEENVLEFPSDLDQLIHESVRRDSSSLQSLTSVGIKTISLCNWSSLTTGGCLTLPNTRNDLKWDEEELEHKRDVFVYHTLQIILETVRPISPPLVPCSSSPALTCARLVLDLARAASLTFYLVALLYLAFADYARVSCYLALEAHIEQGHIVVSVRTVLDHVPTKFERIEKFTEVLAWTTYTDGNRADRPGLVYWEVSNLSDKLNLAMAAAKNYTGFAANDDDDDPKVIDKADETDDIARNGDGAATTDTSSTVPHQFFVWCDSLFYDASSQGIREQR